MNVTWQLWSVSLNTAITTEQSLPVLSAVVLSRLLEDVYSSYSIRAVASAHGLLVSLPSSRLTENNFQSW